MKCKLAAIVLSFLVATFALAVSKDDCEKACQKKLRDCIMAGGYPPTCNDEYNDCWMACPGDDADEYNERGIAKYEKGDVRGALIELNHAIEIDAKSPIPYRNRAIAELHIGDYEQGISDLRRAIQLDSKYTAAVNSLAWLLATCPEARLRDGASAVEYARKACELSGWKKAAAIDTLAAAYAEAGDFERAVDSEEQAVGMEGDAATNRRMQDRLALYEQRKPYREEVKK
jgi:tetratricopeptide (TPR) repeat protein